MTLAERACLVAVVLAVCLLAWRSPSFAQSAEAEVLFRDGRTLIKRGDIAAGCDKLDASERLESSVGTLLNLGDCREKLGRLASAWAAFRKAEALARRTGGDDKRQGEAARRAAELEPRLANLVIAVPARPSGLVVRRNGDVVDPAMWNTKLPVDPGSYTIVAEAPGHRAWRAVVPITAGTRQKIVTVPSLERAPAPPAVAAVPPAPAPPPVIVRHAGTWSAARVLSAGLAVIGAGGIGTGVYFGLRATDFQTRADRVCPRDECADPDGLRWNADARTHARRANILYIAGGATLATAAVLWLVGGPGETVVIPTAGERHAGVSLTGRF